MIQINTNVYVLRIDRGRKKVHVEILGVEDQIDERAPIRIHHAQRNVTRCQLETCRLDVIVEKLNKNLEYIGICRLAPEYILLVVVGVLVGHHFFQFIPVCS
jgi:hypothetical protein